MPKINSSGRATYREVIDAMHRVEGKIESLAREQREYNERFRAEMDQRHAALSARIATVDNRVARIEERTALLHGAQGVFTALSAALAAWFGKN